MIRVNTSNTERLLRLPLTLGRDLVNGGRRLDTDMSDRSHRTSPGRSIGFRTVRTPDSCSTRPSSLLPTDPSGPPDKRSRVSDIPGSISRIEGPYLGPISGESRPTGRVYDTPNSVSTSGTPSNSPLLLLYAEPVRDLFLLGRSVQCLFPDPLPSRPLDLLPDDRDRDFKDGRDVSFYLFPGHQVVDPTFTLFIPHPLTGTRGV